VVVEVVCEVFVVVLYYLVVVLCECWLGDWVEGVYLCCCCVDMLVLG